MICCKQLPMDDHEISVDTPPKQPKTEMSRRAFVRNAAAGFGSLFLPREPHGQPSRQSRPDANGEKETVENPDQLRLAQHAEIRKKLADEAAKSTLDVLKTHEAFQKYGPYALAGPTLVHDDVIAAVVSEYQKNERAAKEITEAIKVFDDKYSINAETAMVACMLQEGGFGAHTGNLSGNYNIGNIRSIIDGRFRDFDSYTHGVEDIFAQLNLYDQKWSEAGKGEIHNLDAALPVYAPPSENPTELRIEMAKKTIAALRNISDSYSKGEMTKAQVSANIHNFRSQLQEEYKNRGEEFI